MQLGLFNTIDRETRSIKLVPVVNDRRFSHTWVIGKTGTGKSTALERWAIDDMLAGDGLAFFDPHGDAVEAILRHAPRRRRSDIILFNPAEAAIGFNAFDHVPDERKPFVASALVDTVKNLWSPGGFPTPALDQFLYNGARALMDIDDGTLFGLKFLLTSRSYRRRVLSRIKDPVIADFWETDFEEHMPEREQRERTLSTLNRIGALIADPLIRAVIAQPRNRLDFSAMMANGQVFLAALPQGRLGLEKSALIGSLLMSQLHLAALGRRSEPMQREQPPDLRVRRQDSSQGNAPRAPQGEHRTSLQSDIEVAAPLKPFHLYVDECHQFGATTLAEMLSGIRKFGVSMVLANQYLAQLPPSLKAALIGSVATTVAFRIGVADAAEIEPEFRLKNDDVSLTELAPFQACVRTGTNTLLLSMPETDAPEYPSAPSRIRRFMTSRYAMPRASIDKRIERFIGNT